MKYLVIPFKFGCAAKLLVEGIEHIIFIRLYITLRLETLFFNLVGFKFDLTICLNRVVTLSSLSASISSFG